VQEVKEQAVVVVVHVDDPEIARMIQEWRTGP